MQFHHKTLSLLLLFLIHFSISTIPTISIVGDLTSKSVLIWIRPITSSENTMPDFVGLSIFDMSSNETLFFTHKKLNAKTDFVSVFELNDLKPNTKYYYKPEYLPKQKEDSNQIKKFGGSFKTLSDYSNKNKFIFGSCLFAQRQPFKVIQHILDLRPEAFLLLGDIAYMDFPKISSTTNQNSLTFEQMASKYRENFKDEYLNKLLRKIPSYMIWDDHEFKSNF